MSIGRCAWCRNWREVAERKGVTGRICAACHKTQQLDQHDKPVFDRETHVSINDKQCHMCSGEFKKGEETTKWNGEYPVHVRCKNGYPNRNKS